MHVVGSTMPDSLRAWQSKDQSLQTDIETLFERSKDMPPRSARVKKKNFSVNVVQPPATTNFRRMSKTILI
jgi:hypothetical protein